MVRSVIGGWLLLGALLVLQDAAPERGPTIRAEQNPVIVAAGQRFGQTTIAWTSDTDAELWIKVESRSEKRVSGDKKGSKTLEFEVGKKAVLTLYKNDALFKLVKTKYGAKALATLEVTARNEELTPPSRTPTNPQIGRASCRERV